MIVHAFPVADGTAAACCGLPPADSDRMTADPHLVTCTSDEDRRPVFQKVKPRRLYGWFKREPQTGRLNNLTMICERCGERWTLSSFNALSPGSLGRDFYKHRQRRACMERWRKLIVRIGPNPLGLAFGKDWPDHFRRLDVDMRRAEVRRLCERVCRPEGGGVCELHGGVHA